MRKYAYVSVITNWKYMRGLSVMLRTLHDTNPQYPVFLVVPDNKEPLFYDTVERMGAKIIKKEPLSFDTNNKVPYWNETMFKLHIFSLTEFDKLLYLDADMIIQKNIDHLFECPSLSAVAAGQSQNPTWTNINSGLLVFKPDLATYNKLIDAIEPTVKEKQAKGQGYGDQDVLYQVFTDWKDQPEYHLDERYNAMLFCLQDIAAAYPIKSIDDIYVLHYVATDKIWNNNLAEALFNIARDIRYRKKYSLQAKLKYYGILAKTYRSASRDALRAMKKAAK